MFDGLAKVIRNEGFLKLFTGAGARVAFWAPNVAINLTIYDSCTKFYRQTLS